MIDINFKRTLSGELEPVIQKLTAKLKDQGFGVLTRIDLHSKIKEKMNQELRPTVILGACNPQLAYQAFLENPDVASLLPCNAVVREVDDGQISVELAKPTALMEMLGDQKLVALSKDADIRLQAALAEL